MLQKLIPCDLENPAMKRSAVPELRGVPVHLEQNVLCQFFRVRGIHATGGKVPGQAAIEGIEEGTKLLFRPFGQKPRNCLPFFLVAPCAHHRPGVGAVSLRV